MLASSTDAIKASLDDLLAKQRVQVFVLFVGSTGALTSTEFVDETARINSLGGDDVLLLVAVDDRTDAIWVSDSLAITNDELNRVISDTLEPALRTGTFDIAVIEAARALGAAASTTQPNPGIGETGPPGGGVTPPPSGGIMESVDGVLIGLVGIVLLGVGLAILLVWLASRVSSWRETEERDRRTGKLARAANAQLIAIDDRIRSSDQEAGFVEAQFEADEAAPFRAAVAQAKTELGGAFEIRQRLDDDQPEDAPTREAMLNDILERLGRAAAALDAQTARIEELRNLERQAPAVLASLPAQVDALAARLPAATATLDQLSAAYAEPAWAAVKGNVAEATKGIAGARAAIDRGTAAVTATGTGVAHEIVTAQQGIAGAARLLDAIDVAARTIRETEAGLGAQLDAAEADLDAALAATPRDGPDGMPSHAADVEAARAALRSARAAAAARPAEPIGAARSAATAQRLAGELLAAVRADAEQSARFAAALEASIAAARAEMDRASDFVATRRGGVGRRARTRLAEAERMLGVAEAERATDPKQAMADAQRADKLAGEAYSLATLDFTQWDRTGRGSAASGGGDFAGAILGGIIGGILSGGGRGAGWGGSSWGSPGSSAPRGGGLFGGSGGGWGGGHSSGGSFGGFGGGGGGGHSAGGHW
ncbi:MAG: TPM domain-containing protein [Chloroflexi bacterium]|nr:TPM domain-containing protein [Chloroflexota bacterium]